MSYKNAKDVLPDELIREIQKYIDGDLLYIPTKSEKTEWGIRSGARQKYAVEKNNRYETLDSYKKVLSTGIISVDAAENLIVIKTISAVSIP